MENKKQAMLEHLQQAQRPTQISPAKGGVGTLLYDSGKPEKVPTLMLNLSEEQKRTPFRARSNGDVPAGSEAV